ncbi:MAG: transporter associated domain-containing protein [Balneolaceae bacterium]|nr:transporter associated domain-containing protein [Balneolaceae bacterium]
MEEIIECELTTDEDEYETLGGLIYHLTERIPNVGERVYFKGLELTIHSVQNNRVRKLRVKQNPDASLKKSASIKNEE